MTQAQLDRAVARSTGEDLCTISQRGFGLVDDIAEQDDADGPYLFLDCCFCGAAVPLASSPAELPEAACCDRCDTVFDYRTGEVYAADPALLLVTHMPGERCRCAA